MSNATIPLREQASKQAEELSSKRVERTSRSTPVWWLVFVRELNELWIGGRALILIIIFSILLGIMAYVLASNSELSLIPPKEMVWLTLEAAVATGLFISLIIGADSFSGERERATLEALLLTPTSRVQIVLGKFLATISPWPVAFLISIPHLYILSQGDEVFGQALVWGAIMGSFLNLAFSALGMAISIWSTSNKTSLFVSLILYLMTLLPTQFPGNAQTGQMGRLLKRVNPMESNNHFLEKILVNNRTLAEFWDWLASPVIFVVLALLVLFVWAAPRMRLEVTKESFWGSGWLSRRFGILLAVCLVLPVWASSASAASLQADLAQSEPAKIDTTKIETIPLSIELDILAKDVKNGESIFFETLVTNKGTETTPQLIVAMNIINLSGDGDPVDPEDWSPQRTQYVEPIAAGESITHSWRLNTILEGNYMLYMVLLTKPGDASSTSQPVTSPGMHVTVQRFIKTNPGGVVPFAIGIPIALLAVLGGVNWKRRQMVDSDGR